MRGWGTSRRALLKQLDQAALGSLPPLPYEYAEWKRCRVGLEYHVEIAKHYYSVPHQLLRHEVEARITAAPVEIFHRGKRVASHRRSLSPAPADHRPRAHAQRPPALPAVAVGAAGVANRLTVTGPSTPLSQAASLRFGNSSSDNRDT
jgi:hypothetical protein